MAIRLECPGCKAVLNIDESLAGKQGKCIHCGHRVVVPGAVSVSPGTISPPLFEATPEAMVRELAARGESALLVLFRPSGDGAYDLAQVADGDLKCIVTDDINASRFGQLIGGIGKRFGPRKKGQPEPLSEAGQLYELKGDQLGMSLEAFKRKYARGEEGSRERLPLCSDEAWGTNRAALHTEPWHRQAGIVNARIDLPSEDNSPTVAGVATELLLYQFIDGQLFRIAAYFPTDQFHVVSEAAVTKYGPVTRETQSPRQLAWENPLSTVILNRGMVHPPEPSTLVLVHRQFAALAESRTPKGAGDI
jgi:hypothetical protein